MMEQMTHKQKVDCVKVTLSLFSPKHDEDYDLMVAESLTAQCLLKCFPAAHSETNLKSLLRQIGDYGDVAVYLSEEKGQGLLLEELVKAMDEINSFEGEDSVDLKIQYIVTLM